MQRFNALLELELKLLLVRINLRRDFKKALFSHSYINSEPQDAWKLRCWATRVKTLLVARVMLSLEEAKGGEGVYSVGVKCYCWLEMKGDLDSF